MSKSIQNIIRQEQRIQNLIQKFHLEDTDNSYEEAEEIQQVVQSYSNGQYGRNNFQSSMEYSYE